MLRYTNILLLMLFCTLLNAQNRWVFKGNITNLQQGTPIENACIHNISNGTATFSNEQGNFAVLMNDNDTLLITHVGYSEYQIIANDSLKRGKTRFQVRMVMKSTLLKGATVYAFKPYPIFLEDVAKEANATGTPIMLTESQKADATANPEPHLYTAHPISALYNTFSRKAKLDQLYHYLNTHEDEVNQLQQKYNPEIVSRLSGLEGGDLEDFMCYCSFSYYKLIQANENEIAHMIIDRLQEYRKKNGE